MQSSRRQFMGLLGAGAVVAAAGSRSRAESGPTIADTGPLRDAFAFDEAHVPMNAANLCPCPVGWRKPLPATPS